jgi:hypothetical protein
MGLGGALAEFGLQQGPSIAHHLRVFQVGPGIGKRCGHL